MTEPGVAQRLLVALRPLVFKGALLRSELQQTLEDAGVTLLDVPAVAMWLMSEDISIVDVGPSPKSTAESAHSDANDVKGPPDTTAWGGPRPAADGFEAFAKGLRHRILSIEEEAALGKRLETGRMAEQMIGELAGRTDLPDGVLRDFRRQALDGKRAGDELALHNLRLVTSIANRYRGRCGPSLEFEDLVQEGYLGLAHAIELWDFRRELKFSTYATWWIRQTITRSLDDKVRSIRLPVHFAEKVRLLARTEAELSTRFGGPSAERLAAALGWSKADVEAVRQNRSSISSLDAAIGNRRSVIGASLIDSGRTPEDVVTDRDCRAALLRCIRTVLDQKEERIVWLRFGLDGSGRRTLEEVSADYGVTRERIRQIESRALTKLRSGSVAVELRSLLDESPERLPEVGAVPDGDLPVRADEHDERKSA